MNESNAIVAGMVLGAIITMVSVVLLIPPYNIKAYNKAIAECEQNLPRNQRCEITARVIEE